ncbi:PEP-CTERM sorting domain-containing protein [Duganella sp. FT135W]|uniref:PEP-CTERM sorting domain-containing protein n=1 Tax=Duganella flavida TaxID=2692175 RepID=A0A6L8K342_9BURK|nr:PEP-CTERM sorting domain-containing protein [Duganella flavida]MYM21610.1 PEP-CTERM sorting domain-containing protein [Duganella flavida]
MKFIKSMLAATATVLTLGSAQAEVITYEFTATITSIAQFDPSLPFRVDSVNILGNTVRTYDTVHGIMSYDTSAPIWTIQKRVPVPIVFYKDMGHMSLSFQGGLNFDSTAFPETPQMAILNNSTTYEGGDGISFSTASRIDPDQHANIFLFDQTGTAFNNTALPTNLDLNRFDQRSLTYDFGSDDHTIEVSATVTSIQLISAVPEPSTGMLMMAGLSLLAWRRRNATQRATA